MHYEVHVEDRRIKDVLSEVTGIENEEEKREFCTLNEREGCHRCRNGRIRSDWIDPRKQMGGVGGCECVL